MALTAALHSYREATIQERISTEDGKFIRDDSHVASLVKAALTGMPNDVRHLLEDGTTSVRDLGQLTQMDNADFGEWIYLLVHIWEDGTIGLYVGTSQSLTERINAHKTEIAGKAQPNNLHYTFARGEYMSEHLFPFSESLKKLETCLSSVYSKRLVT